MLAVSAVGDDVDFLSLLSDVNRRRFLQGATKGTYRAGAHVFRQGSPPKSFLIDGGLVRAYMTVPDGRQATIGFRHTKELVAERWL